LERIDFLRLSGRLIKGTMVLGEAEVENTESGITYTERLERSLIELCKKLDIPVPIWLEKNTREFVMFRRTFFFDGQFTEKVAFDMFEIKELK